MTDTGIEGQGAAAATISGRAMVAVPVVRSDSVEKLALAEGLAADMSICCGSTGAILDIARRRLLLFDRTRGEHVVVAPERIAGIHERRIDSATTGILGAALYVTRIGLHDLALPCFELKFQTLRSRDRWAVIIAALRQRDGDFLSEQFASLDPALRHVTEDGYARQLARRYGFAALMILAAGIAAAAMLR